MFGKRGLKRQSRIFVMLRYSNFNPSEALNVDFPAVQNTVSDATPGWSLL